MLFRFDYLDLDRKRSECDAKLQTFCFELVSHNMNSIRKDSMSSVVFFLLGVNYRFHKVFRQKRAYIVRYRISWLSVCRQCKNAKKFIDSTTKWLHAKSRRRRRRRNSKKSACKSTAKMLDKQISAHLN